MPIPHNKSGKENGGRKGRLVSGPGLGDEGKAYMLTRDLVKKTLRM